MIFLLILFNILSLLAQTVSPVIDPNKYTVCAITINSSEEKRIFEQQAEKFPKKFNPVVELTDFGEEDWFQNACKSKIKCDQLVVSGHFAGGFFGESGKHLNLKELESAGCNKTCEGILSEPLEVFLFGCNTLATREKDNRTPAQYLQVLLNDNIPRRRAELIVESRYGSYGDNNKATMMRAFSGSEKQIYGFDSVGPSGKNVKAFLENYFKKVSAPQRLADVENKRVLKQVTMSNQYLASSLKSTAFTQCHVSSNDEKSVNICTLLSNKLTTAQKLDKVQSIFELPDYQSYLQALGQFFSTIDRTTLSPQDAEALELISKNKILKSQILGFIVSTNSPEIKSEILALAGNMRILDKNELNALIKPDVSKLLASPLTDNDQVDRICDISSNLGEVIQFEDMDVSRRPFNSFDLAALSCLKIKDPQFNERVLKDYVVADSYYTDKAMIYFIKKLSTESPLSEKSKNIINLAMASGTYAESFEAMKLSNLLIKDNPEIERGTDRICGSPQLDYMNVCAEAFSKNPKISSQRIFEFVTGLAYSNKPECLKCLDYVTSLSAESPQNQINALHILFSVTNYTPSNKSKLVKYLSSHQIQQSFHWMLLNAFNRESNLSLKKEMAVLLRSQKDLAPQMISEIDKAGF